MAADAFEEDEAPVRIKPGPGRQTEYTEELADHICTNLAYGTPLAEICRSLEIGRTTVYDWQRANPSFAARIARAREIGFDAIAEDCLAIADAPNATTSPTTGEVEVRDPARDRLRVETRLKLLAKWDPKRYGDKVTAEHTGPNGGPIQYAAMSREERAARIRQLEEKRRAAD